MTRGELVFTGVLLVAIACGLYPLSPTTTATTSEEHEVPSMMSVAGTTLLGKSPLSAEECALLASFIGFNRAQLAYFEQSNGNLKEVSSLMATLPLESDLYVSRAKAAIRWTTNWIATLREAIAKLEAHHATECAAAVNASDHAPMY